MRIESSAFAGGSEIPVRHTSFGENLSPPLAWDELPDETRTLALLCEDPDAPSGTFVHWLAWNIRPDAGGLAEGAHDYGMREGRNDFGKTGYGGPRPPPGKPHRYVFHVYALDSDLALPPGAKREEFERAIRGHVLEERSVIGSYGR